MKIKILSLIKKESIGDRHCVFIENCMNEDTGLKHVAIVYDNNEEGAQNRLIDEFMDRHSKGLIKDGFI